MSKYFFQWITFYTQLATDILIYACCAILSVCVWVWLCVFVCLWVWMCVFMWVSVCVISRFDWQVKARIIPHKNILDKNTVCQQCQRNDSYNQTIFSVLYEFFSGKSCTSSGVTIGGLTPPPTFGWICRQSKIFVGFFRRFLSFLSFLSVHRTWAQFTPPNFLSIRDATVYAYS